MKNNLFCTYQQNKAEKKFVVIANAFEPSVALLYPLEISENLEEVQQCNAGMRGANETTTFRDNKIWLS